MYMCAPVISKLKIYVRPYVSSSLQFLAPCYRLTAKVCIFGSWTSCIDEIKCNFETTVTNFSHDSFRCFSDFLCLGCNGNLPLMTLRATHLHAAWMTHTTVRNLHISNTTATVSDVLIKRLEPPQIIINVDNKRDDVVRHRHTLMLFITDYVTILFIFNIFKLTVYRIKCTYTVFRY